MPVTRPRSESRLHVALGRLGYAVAYRGLLAVRFLAGRHTRGVRCVLRRGEDVLLVRHTYGDRGWALPGGRVRRGETPIETARREIAAEVGMEVSEWREVGAFGRRGRRRKATTLYLRADVGAHAGVCDLRPARLEISDVAWFPLRALPGDCSPALGQARDAGFLEN